MKQQRHKREESYSLLLISNTGKECRHFYVTVRIMRLLTIFLLVICAALVWIMCRSGVHYKTESDLRRRLAMSEQRVKQLEDEKKTLDNKNAALLSENEELKATEQTQENESQEAESMEAQKDTAIPSQNPYTGVGILTDQYSEEHPYVSISAQLEDRIIAAGDGTVASISSDDTYPLVIEVEHGNGYKSRYMCLKEADVRVSVGEQVEMRDTLIVINNEETQLDYQVIYNEQAIDPLLVLEAKG